MRQGRVRKAYNSFFYVDTGAEELVSCKLRGRFKKSRKECCVVPGDCVRIELLPDKTGVIEEVLPRETLLRRPAVANVTQVVLTFAAAQPDLHLLLVNRFLVLAEWSCIPKVRICINKIDLARENADTLLADYERIGYSVLHTSAQEGVGVDALREALAGEVTVFAGPSGVGKSSLLNAAMLGLSLKAGAISEKIKRGRHTTRVAELIPCGAGYLVDTPGFSAMELEGLELAKLAACFPEFRPYLGACRFAPCSHTHEPDCAVKAAAEKGEILSERYDAYRTIYQEIEEGQKLLRRKAYK